MSANVLVRRGSDVEVLRDAALYGAIRRAFEVYRRLMELEDEFGRLKKDIARSAGGGSVSFRAGDVRCTVAERREATIEGGSLREARRILGRRFYDLVRVQKRYLATSDLLEDGRLDGLITVKEFAPRIRFERHG